jgi:3-hydroxyisobutyrate dehydrogenase
VAYDIDRENSESIAALGARIGCGPADVASRAQRVVSMVETTAQAEEVIVGADGFIEAAQPGDVVISLSSIDPTAVQQIPKALAAKGVDLIYAPVSAWSRARGSERQRRLSANALAVEKPGPFKRAMAAEVIHLGPIGLGLVMKLVIEALVLGPKVGLDPQTMVDVIGHASPFLQPHRIHHRDPTRVA